MKEFEIVLFSENKEIESFKIKKNNFVSRTHAEIIFLEEGELVIKDLDSSNGTLIDGKKISANQSVKLKADNKITFGDSKKYLFVKETKQKKKSRSRDKKQFKRSRSRSEKKEPEGQKKEEFTFNTENVIFNKNSYYSKTNKYNQPKKEIKFSENSHRRKNEERNSVRNSRISSDKVVNRPIILTKTESKIEEYLRLKRLQKKEEEEKELKEKKSEQEKSNQENLNNNKETNQNFYSSSSKQNTFLKEFQLLRNKSN